jgi:hypothetical protein
MAALREAVDMGPPGGQLLLDTLDSLSLADYRSVMIIESLSETRWFGAIVPLRNILRSPNASRNTEIIGATLLALARVAGDGASVAGQPHGTTLSPAAWDHFGSTSAG